MGALPPLWPLRTMKLGLSMDPAAKHHDGAREGSLKVAANHFLSSG
jgi:hypothetical protein